MLMKINQFFKIEDDYGREISRLAKALRTIVKESGTESYKEKESLPVLLQNQGVDMVDIRKVELVLETSNFLRYLDQLSEGISAIDINNIIQSAENSGLTLETLKIIISDLLYGIGITQKIRQENYSEGWEKSSGFSSQSIYLTPYAYKDSLDKVEKNIKEKKKLEASEFSYLNYCCTAGVPRAARILGKLYLQGTYVGKDLKKAKEYLKFAVHTGDAGAMVLLGDYYYEMAKYNEAYELYTSPGALAVNGDRKSRVRDLYDIKKYNKKEVFIWGIITIITEFLILYVCADSVITGKHIVMKVICSILNIGTFAAILWKGKKEMFSDLRGYGLMYGLIAFLYYFVYILI